MPPISSYLHKLCIFNYCGVQVLPKSQSNIHVHARFDLFMVVKIQVKVFWVVMLWSHAEGYQCFRGPCSLHIQSEDGGSKILQNNGILLAQHYMASQPGRPQLEALFIIFCVHS